MTEHARALLREALAMPPRDRADMAAELVASLDDPDLDDAEAARAAWIDEIERRARRVLDGGDNGQDWHDVREQVGRRLSSE
jgi:hypothetical protein